jgi:hypothetical protein
MRALSLHTSILCSLTLAAAGCGGGGSSQHPGGGMPTMKMVGPSGGAVSSSDGNLAVNIPAGALPADVTVTTEPVEAPAMGAVGTVYEIGPTGTQFAMPVTLTLHYDSAMLNGAATSSLRVATFAGGAWQILPGAMVDTQAKTVSGVTTHLSPYAIVTEEVGKTCATVQTAFGCPATAKPAGSAGGTSSGTDPGTTGTGATGGGSSTCQVPTCAGATDVCTQYPGASMDSCTDSSTGYSAACCFAPNAPICFAIGGVGAPCTSTGGAGAAECQAAPTCASAAATACAGYPGATLQNCTDSTNGFKGACCFAAQAPVCVKTGAGRACAPSTGGGATNCPPPPRCADGNPCGGFVGAKASSCTDTADGFEATCCFPDGTLPITVGSGSGMGGSSGTDGGVPAADGGPVDPTGKGGTSGTTGAGGTGGTTGGTCVAGATCTAGYRCGNASSNGACMDCMCGADGKLTCMPCDKPDGGGAGATTGTGGTGGTTGGGTCVAGATCSANYRCGGASPTGECMDCTCGADGKLTCISCDKPDGGGAGATTGTGGVGGTGGTTGGTTCAPGATCSAGFRCPMPGPAGECNECMCGADGMLTCGPCDKTGAGGTGATTGAGGVGGTGGTTGGTTCAPGAACSPNFRCPMPGPAGECNECMCGTDGMLTCGPCDKTGAGGTSGTTGTGGAGGTTGGPVSGPCQVNPMPPADVGQPCGVREFCPDGNDYRVLCDGTTGACTCYEQGVPTATSPTMSCSNFNVSAFLVACGFPDGKI